MPRERLRPFFRSLGGRLWPGGGLFFVDELVSAADAAGIDLEVRESETYFQYGTGRRR
ncbi:hypothetical protein [Streptomyces xylophagus]|uniref:hypothetical protein n=1 Tax=Streptomyces xylophagus TaxID=285514 RepID=UPI000A8B9CB3|nr:hypothetical protein [Streptomyces xylophagus]